MVDLLGRRDRVTGTTRDPARPDTPENFWRVAALLLDPAGGRAEVRGIRACGRPVAALRHPPRAARGAARRAPAVRDDAAEDPLALAGDLEAPARLAHLAPAADPAPA